jgi:regulator of sirC expression with transglutaminase-like and TPR domain
VIRPAILCLALMLASSAQAAGTAAKWAGNADYQKCFAAVRGDPKEGHRFATVWRDAGGGPAAEHCLALAMLALGYYQESAQRLDDLAERLTADDPTIAVELHGQAANAWSLAAKPARARLAQSAALKLKPDDVELLIDRSVTSVALGEFWEAVDDLSRATDLAPKRPEVLALRASAYRRLEALDLAEDDIARALALEPAHLDSLLERGILRRLKGDAAGARRDWLAVVRAGGETPAAEAARNHLEQLDLKTR